MTDDFLSGLSADDAIAVTYDRAVYGTAMVIEVDGIKRRIPPHEWHTERPTSDDARIVDSYSVGLRAARGQGKSTGLRAFPVKERD